MLRFSAFNRVFFRLLASVFIVAALLPTTGMAYEDDDWMGFNTDSATSWEQHYDRSAARQWELNPPLGFPTVSAENIGPMKAAIKRYSRIVANGGWPTLPRHTKLSPGMSSPLVAQLRRRLLASGDLKQNAGFRHVYDSYVREAVKRFQRRHGLTPTGFVDKNTVLALNVPAAARLRQLRINLSRMVNYSRVVEDKYVLVNIPAAQVETVKDGQVVSRHSAVVGKIDRQSPILHSRIHEINFNPYWNVPRSIVRKDLVPKAREYARRGKDFLKLYRMSALDSAGREIPSSQIDWFSPDVYKLRFRQEPWDENSMGFVKINFHNKHAVFMHDTPTQSLFGRNYRAYSSGCVRIQNIQQVVSWLLEENGDWPHSRVAEMKRNGARVDVKLKKRAGVHFVYVTAWVTPDGTVNFRRDIYRRDGVGLSAAAY